MATWRSTFTRDIGNGRKTSSSRDFTAATDEAAEAAAERHGNFAKNTVNHGDPRVTTRVEKIR